MPNVFQAAFWRDLLGRDDHEPESYAPREWTPAQYQLPPKSLHTAIEGYTGPHYPNGIDSLQRACDLDDSAGWFGIAAREVRGAHFKEEVYPQGEGWAAGYVFELDPHTDVMVLFADKEDGESVWHCAVYLRESGVL